MPNVQLLHPMKTKILCFLKINKVLKFIPVIGTAVSISISLYADDEFYSILSLFLFSFNYILMLIETILIGVNYRKTNEMLKSVDFGITSILMLLIIVFGLFFGYASDNEYYKFLWIITVIFYAFNGAAFSLSTNIPIKMTYGGWKVVGSKKL